VITNLLQFYPYSFALHQILGGDETKMTRWSVVCSTHGVNGSVKYEGKVKKNFGKTFAERQQKK
jgi:hypothetical protein